MKRVILCICLLGACLLADAQAPKLYINIVSHNEPGDSLQLLIPFNEHKGLLLQMADLVIDKGAKWNLGTCDGLVDGAIQHQNAFSSNQDILEMLGTPPYGDNIEIDARTKTKFGRNIADTWFLLDSIGARPSDNVSGFIFSSSTAQQPDWFQFNDTVKGTQYGYEWKAEVIWGAGSLPPHSNDLNDFGIWKPDSVSNFFHHHETRSEIWYQGNGCQPLQSFDSLENEQTIIADIRQAIDSIQGGFWPDTLFYCYSIVVNQREMGPMLFQKLGVIMDSVRFMGNDKVEWAKISEKHDLFLQWRDTTERISQWQCPYSMVAVAEPQVEQAAMAYPNPFIDHLSLDFPKGGRHEVTLHDLGGRACLRAQVVAGQSIPTGHLAPGLYFISVDGMRGGKVQKMSW